MNFLCFCLISALVGLVIGAPTKESYRGCDLRRSLHLLDCSGAKNVVSIPDLRALDRGINHLKMDSLVFDPGAKLSESAVALLAPHITQISFFGTKMTSKQCREVTAWKELLATFIQCVNGKNCPREVKLLKLSSYV